MLPVSSVQYLSSALSAAKEREKVQKAAAQRSLAPSAVSSRVGTPVNSPSKSGNRKGQPVKRTSGTSTPSKKGSADQQTLDMAALNLGTKLSDVPTLVEEPPKMALAKEKLLEEAKKVLDAEAGGKKGLSIVVIGARSSRDRSQPLY